MTEDKLQALAKSIIDYRDTPPHSGIGSQSGRTGKGSRRDSADFECHQAGVLRRELSRSVAWKLLGPRIGADLRQQAINVVLIALAAMLVYIAFRFEWIYGVAAVIAVFHDTIITIGLFSLFNKQIDLTVIAALLTLVGYSMNDTIVDLRSYSREFAAAAARLVHRHREPQHQSDPKPDGLDLRPNVPDRFIAIFIWRTGTKWIFFRAGRLVLSSGLTLRSLSPVRF